MKSVQKAKPVLIKIKKSVQELYDPYFPKMLAITHLFKCPHKTTAMLVLDCILVWQVSFSTPGLSEVMTEHTLLLHCWCDDESLI